MSSIITIRIEGSGSWPIEIARASHSDRWNCRSPPAECDLTLALAEQSIWRPGHIDRQIVPIGNQMPNMLEVRELSNEVTVEPFCHPDTDLFIDERIVKVRENQSS